MLHNIQEECTPQLHWWKLESSCNSNGN